MRPILLTIALIVCSTTSLGRAPELRVAAVLGDGAVLQSGVPVPVWGWSAPAQRIDVRLGNQQKSAIAAVDGSWRVVFDPLEAGPLGNMSVLSGKQALTISDLLAGEVWVCSGQSNMQMSVSAADGSEEELKRPGDPELRLFAVPRIASARSGVNGRWQRSNASSAPSFSAVGYYFGRELRRRLRTPVGVIMAAWGGTAAEAWTPAESLSADPEFAPILARWNERVTRNPDVLNSSYPFRLEIAGMELVHRDGSSLPLAAIGPASRWEAPVADAASRASLANGSKTTFSGALGISGSAEIVLGLERSGAPADLANYLVLRLRARGSGRFSLQLRQRSVTDWAWHAVPHFFATGSWQDYEFRLQDFAQPSWGEQKALTLSALSGIAICTEAFMVPPSQPSSLYESMLRPIIPHAIRGALWYQGETNAGRAYQYRRLLPALISGWRRAWGQGDFPFYVVQLPGYGPISETAVDDEWAEMREAQTAVLDLANTGLVCTIDIGEPGNVHPRNKIEVSMRLARLAMAKTYGKGEEYSGPKFAAARFEGNRVRITFDEIGPGLATRNGEPLRGFSVAGEDRVFHKSVAMFDGDTVVVESEEVPNPVAVRYGWAASPVCNLVGAEGLPAWPFRSDKWPGKTDAAR